MASTLSTAELPRPERGASVVPTAPRIAARLARLADRALAVGFALAARHDLDATALLGVAGGVDKVRAGLDQIAAACAPPRAPAEAGVSAPAPHVPQAVPPTHIETTGYAQEIG
jgi:hypothetical protein